MFKINKKFYCNVNNIKDFYLYVMDYLIVKLSSK